MMIIILIVWCYRFSIVSIIEFIIQLIIIIMDLIIIIQITSFITLIIINYNFMCQNNHYHRIDHHRPIILFIFIENLNNRQYYELMINVTVNFIFFFINTIHCLIDVNILQMLLISFLQYILYLICFLLVNYFVILFCYAILL